MKILFDLTALYDHLTGIERYNMCITKSIVTRYPKNDYILIFKQEVHEAFSEIVKEGNVRYMVLPECNKLKFIQWDLYKCIRSIEADYYIFLSFTSPILLRKKGIINAIHDLTCWDCPETIPTKMKYYYRYTYQKSIKHSDRIITVSNFSKERICRRYNLNRDRVSVVYDGLTSMFKQIGTNIDGVRKKYNLPDSFILSLSTIEPRKNLQLLLKAYSELLTTVDELPDLVLAGRQGWKLNSILQNLPAKTVNKIHFTGFIDDEDLPSLYRAAALFVFPSMYEGFGLPVIEAMSQETLVLSSNAASLPEICGENCVMFHSNNVESLINGLIVCLAMTESDKERYVKEGRVRAVSFDWDKEADKMASLIRII